MMIKNLTAKEKYEGCLVGLAVGDALGAPLEFLSGEEIRRDYGKVTDYVKALPGHAFSNFDPGQYTDDTQLAIAMAASIAAKERFDDEDFALKLADWYKAKDFRSAGKATREACRALAKGKSITESGIINAAGSGSAVRAVPLGLVYNGLDQDSGKALVSDCIYSSILTHKSQLAVGAAAAAAISVNYVKLLKGQLDVDTFLKVVSDFTGYTEFVGMKEWERSYDNTLEPKIKELRYLKDESFEKGIKKIGYGGYVLELIPSAILAFIKSPDDFEKTVVEAANAGGDADSRAALAGAISGAYNGIGNIPSKFTRNLENYENIISLAGMLLDIPGYS